VLLQRLLYFCQRYCLAAGLTSVTLHFSCKMIPFLIVYRILLAVVSEWSQQFVDYELSVTMQTRC
jgi:hypothetical protein